MGMATSRKRRLPAPVVGILTLLVIGGGATAYASNRRAAAPRTPLEVAQRFVDIALVTHQENAAVGLVCNPNSLAIYDLRWKLADIESRDHLTSKLSFHDWRTVEASPEAHVTMRISIEFPGAPERDHDENWKLDLKHSNSWRVCTARKVDGRA